MKIMMLLKSINSNIAYHHFHLVVENDNNASVNNSRKSYFITRGVGGEGGGSWGVGDQNYNCTLIRQLFYIYNGHRFKFTIIAFNKIKFFPHNPKRRGAKYIISSKHEHEFDICTQIVYRITTLLYIHTHIHTIHKQ